jgi:tetratricopeptide (TPR) repeat protein
LNEVLDTPDLSADVRYGAVLRRGHLHLKSRSWAAALEDFLEAQSLGDDSRHVRLHLVALWRVLGQDRRADALLEQILSGRSDADQASTLATHAIRLSWDLKWHEHALGVCERALEIEEETARAWTSRGEVLLQLDRLEEAVKSFERALQLEPTILDAKMKLGSALIRLERPHEALRIYDDVLAERPRLAFALNARGYLLSTFLQRNEEALKAHDEAIRLDPMDARYHGCRGSVLWRLNRHEEALAAFDEAIRLEPRLPFEHWTWLRKQRAGLLCDVFGRFEDALVDIDAALRSAPADPWCLPARALTLSNLHRWNEAIEAADRSLALQPNQIPIHRVRWRALNALGRYAEALECCDGAARLFRARPHWHYTARAAILNNLGRYDEALQEVESAIELAPNSASGHHVRAYAFDKLGRHEEAIAGFRRALALDASRRGSATNLAWILVTAPAGDLRAPREALELVRRARSAKPTSFSGLVLGVAHYRLGEMDAAAESIEEALRGFDETEEIIFESTRVKAMLFLAMTHARLGDANAAQSWFTAAIDRMERHNVEEPDLGRFRAEAEEVLGIEPK